MSKGPGKWQRVILNALETYTAVYVLDLLPAGFTKSDYVAILRAANSLEATGKIETDRYQCGVRRLVVKRPGYHIPRESIVSVDKVTRRDFVNTYDGEITTNFKEVA